MIFTALVMGFAGSLHCLGMCSPLAMAVTGVHGRAMLNRFLYNAGRIVMYGFMGAAVAAAGIVFPFNRYQNLLSIILGVTVIVVTISGTKAFHFSLPACLLNRFSSWLKSHFQEMLQRKNSLSTFLLGMLNGLLPCGLTFLALTFCLTLKGPLDGFNFMLLFGVGTLPAMLGGATLLQYPVTRLHLNRKTVTTVLLLVSGCLLIVRGVLPHPIPAGEETQNVVDIILCR